MVWLASSRILRSLFSTDIQALAKSARAAAKSAIRYFFIGFFLSSQYLVNLGIILFSTLAIFQLATLPVEFNASDRAITTLAQSGILYGEEINGAKKVLKAAALTYVAALVSSLAQLLRLILIFGGRRRD